MVILHVKRGSEKKNEYLCEKRVAQSVDEVTAELAEMHNLRIKVLRLAVSLKELGTFGPH